MTPSYPLCFENSPIRFKHSPSFVKTNNLIKLARRTRNSDLCCVKRRKTFSHIVTISFLHHFIKTLSKSHLLSERYFFHLSNEKTPRAALGAYAPGGTPASSKRRSRLTNLLYSFTNARDTVPTGPLRCLAIIISIIFLFSVSLS